MATLITSAEEIKALIQLLQRTPMTPAEALFTNALFSGWLAQLELGALSADQLAHDPTYQPDQPGGAAASDVLAAGGNGTSDQASQASRARQPSTPGTDQVQSI